MSFTREINRLMFGLLAVFFVIVTSATYWAVVGEDSILLRDDNPRLVEDEARIRRGSIYDTNNILLADSRLDDAGFLQRRYYHPEMNSALGYFSLRYGTSGAESAYDSYLRGDIFSDELNDFVQQDMLHIPQQGLDIQLTFDVNVQQTMLEQMQDYRGAAVVLSVPDGRVLGLVSLPTYNPNMLDANWEELVDAEGNPFFNRVLQGQYQPGGMLQTPLMVANILAQQPFDIIIADANQPVVVEDLELRCAVEPESPDLSYAEAYAYGCPLPFSLLANDLTPTSLQNIFDAFSFSSPPNLQGFVEETTTIEETPEVTPEFDVLADVIGQGNLTINPLGMATLASAIVNNGNAPQPYALQSYQLADGTWQIDITERPTSPLLTVNSARRLRDLMVNNIQEGASVSASRPNLTIGGHTALAISGDEFQTWFIGFVTLENNQSATIAIVLENTEDAEETARIAGIILESAANSLRETSD
ncbi:MAG: penicillin-binding protein 2 [Phototrophicaceae bacterium]